MIYFIVNTASRTGRGKEVWHRVRQKLEQENIPYKAYRTRYKGHAMELAAAITGLKNGSNPPDEVINLVVLGGDGTMNEVINGIRDFERVRFGIIPGGSGNDFIRGLGLPKDPIKNLNLILNAVNDPDHKTGRIDLGQAEVDGRIRLFGISSGIGLDAIVCKQVLTSTMKKVLNRLHLGSLIYILLTVKNLFTMETADAQLTYMANEMKLSTEKKDLIFAAAMNLSAEGGGVPMAPFASCRDGKLSLTLAGGIQKWHTFFLLPFLAAGKQGGIKGFQTRDANEIRICLTKPMTVHTDGEYFCETDHIIFRCQPDTLNLLHKKNRRSKWKSTLCSFGPRQESPGVLEEGD